MHSIWENRGNEMSAIRPDGRVYHALAGISEQMDSNARAIFSGLGLTIGRKVTALPPGVDLDQA